jgi:hypothetical protein
MIILFSLPIRFQVLTLPVPDASLVDTLLMMLNSRHPRDVTRKTIFVGEIV